MIKTLETILLATCLFVMGFGGLFLMMELIQYARHHTDHIEYLEEYIRQNDLPVPAWPIRDGKVVFEIEVPICN